MNAGKGSFRNDNSSLEFEFMDMMKENSGGNYMDADSTSGFNAFASGEAAMIVTGEFSLLNAQSINRIYRLVCLEYHLQKMRKMQNLM